MPLTTATIPVGATYAPTGGAATTIKSLGQTLDSHKLYFDDGADIILRKTMLATAKPSVPSSGAPNGYTQTRSKVVFHNPILLDNGIYTTNTVSIEVSFDPETDSSERAALRALVSYAGDHANFDDLFDDGSTS